MLSPSQAEATAKMLLDMRRAELVHLDRIRAYWRGKQPSPVPPTGMPREVRELAAMSRVNIVRLPVDVFAQSLYVVGYRPERDTEDAPQWAVWQANRLDKHQTGVHRAALAYGASYVVVLPGDPVPVMRGVSPRRLTAAYGADPEWPLFAIEVTRSKLGVEFRLYDDDGVYTLADDPEKPRESGEEFAPVWLRTEEHGLGRCPVVRFRATEDLDDEDGDAGGEVEPLMPLQDQIDLTTFELLVAQHFQSFRQRYVLGWTAPDEATKAKASASRLWTFDDPDVTVGEFGQVDLRGYLDSREAAQTNLAMMSQTPPHAMLGKMVNLSAEALAAAEAGKDRKLAERETNFGESWEQALSLAGTAQGIPSDDGAQVIWRDTQARSFAATVDALGKLAQMLHVPVELLWERIPGFTQQDVERAKALMQSGSAIDQLASLLDQQAMPATA